MRKAKYTNQEQTEVQITDTETEYNKCGPVHRLQKELEGLEIEPFETEEEANAKIKAEANEKHDSIEQGFLIEANGRVYNFNPMATSKFGLKLLSSKPGDIIKWTAYDNVQYDHSLEEAQTIFEAGDVFLYSLHDAKQLDKTAADTGDFSLSNLNAIQDNQNTLRGT